MSEQFIQPGKVFGAELDAEAGQIMVHQFGSTVGFGLKPDEAETIAESLLSAAAHARANIAAKEREQEDAVLRRAAGIARRRREEADMSTARCTLQSTGRVWPKSCPVCSHGPCIGSLA